MSQERATERQLTFDWPKRMERDRLIDLINFGTQPFDRHKRVSSATLKGVLNRINRFQVNMEGRRTIAQAIGVSEKQISRAVKLLAAHDLIVIDRKVWRGRNLNHYSINWTSLRLLIERQEPKNHLPSNGTKANEQWDTMNTNNGTFSNEQWDTMNETNGTLCATEIEKEHTKETTTEAAWECVVFLLDKKFKVGGWRKAIAQAKARNASPSEVNRIIERIANDPNIPDSDKAGAMFNQVCNPPPEPEIKPQKRTLKKPDREIIRQRVFMQVRDSKRGTDSEPVPFRDLEPEIERITNEIYARDLKAYEESRYIDSQPPQHSIQLEAVR
ncbi:MAG: hypothetical protein ACK5PB_23380 [Pirellula sp.]